MHAVTFAARSGKYGANQGDSSAADGDGLQGTKFSPSGELKSGSSCLSEVVPLVRLTLKILTQMQETWS